MNSIGRAVGAFVAGLLFTLPLTASSPAQAPPGKLNDTTATGQLVSPGTAAEFAISIEEQRKKLAAIAQELGIKQAQ